MPLIERDQVVEAFVAEGPHHPLGDRVRPRRSHRREDRLDAQPSRPPDEASTVDGVPVPHEVAGPAAPGGGLDQLAPPQAAVGWAVTARWTSSRRPWVMKNST